METIKVDKSELRRIIDDISRKLFLLEWERIETTRRLIIEEILENDTGELQRLKKLLNLKIKGD